MDIAARLDALEGENEALRERVRQLETELFSLDVQLPIEWRLTRSEARLFGALLSKEVATKGAVMLALYGDRPDGGADTKIVDVFVCKLRRKLKPFGIAIHTEWGVGYRLHPADRHRYRRRLPDPPSASAPLPYRTMLLSRPGVRS